MGPERQLNKNYYSNYEAQATITLHSAHTMYQQKRRRLTYVTMVHCHHYFSRDFAIIAGHVMVFADVSHGCPQHSTFNDKDARRQIAMG